MPFVDVTQQHLLNSVFDVHAWFKVTQVARTIAIIKAPDLTPRRVAPNQLYSKQRSVAGSHFYTEKLLVMHMYIRSTYDPLSLQNTSLSVI